MIQAPPQRVARPPRVLVGEEHSARVRLWRADEVNPTEYPAELVDVSHGGAKLRIATCLRFEESVHLRIEIASVDLSSYVLGTVRHIRPGGEGRWIVGCSIEPPLDEEIFARLANQTSAERRRAPRYAISIPVILHRQLGASDTTAHMENVSVGGIGVRTSRPCDAGERMRVTVTARNGNQSTVEVCVQWQVKTANGYITGCRFLNPEDINVVRSAVGDRDVVEALRPHPVERLTPKTQISLFLIVCAFLLVAWSMLTTGFVEEAPRSSPFTAEAGLDATLPPSPPIPPEPASQRSAIPGVPLNDQALSAHGTALDDPPLGNRQGNHETETEPAHDVVPAADADAPSKPISLGHSLEDELVEPTADAAVREWTDDTGRFRVKATLLGTDTETVLLRRSDGRTITVPFARLSPTDRDYVRRWREAL